MPHALVIDDDLDTRTQLAEIVVGEGFTVVVAATMQEALLHMDRQCPDLVLTDLRLPDGSAMKLVTDRVASSDTEMILITGNARVETAIEALRLGALDYLTKPINFRRLKNLLTQVRSQKSALAPRTVIRPPADFGAMFGTSPAMQSLYDQISRVAPTDATVLLLGESGTGKELAAQSVHEMSLRQRQAFLPVNCGAISPQLIESEIFGHEKGSFTGADRQHKGYFERASGGTLFLDEITEMPMELQVKLLRVLENGTFMRIGSSMEVDTNVRLIAATNRDPDQAVTEGKLRLDLYHRLNVFPIRIPPLRERAEDAELLARHFLAALNQSHDQQKILSEGAIASLKTYHWPGNVRELRNYVQRGFILSDRIIDTQVLAPPVSNQPSVGLSLAIPVGTSLAEVDRKFIFATLDLCGGVKKRAADLLGISLKTLYNRLEEYNQEKNVPSIQGDGEMVPVEMAP